jgi:TolB-like protein
MGFIKEIRERRLYAYLGAYLVTGFVALEGVDQLISYEILPEVAYPIALAWYLLGIGGAMVFAWYHGEKGRQETTKAELAMHGALAVLALATSVYIFTSKQAAAELAAAAASSGLDPNSVAVLYFEDLSPGGELDYVADGITEALIDRLSEVRSLDIISKNGVEPYRGADITVDSIARALEVGSVIRGSVEQAGDELRVTTRLVDGFSGADIERTTSEIPAGDFLAARDSVAESVSRLLRQRLGEEVQLRERQAGTASVQAWSLAQRAERLRKQSEDAFDEGGLDDAIAASRQADSLLAIAERADSTWSESASARANAAYRRAYFYANAGDFESASEAIDLGLEHAQRALTLDPNNANALEQRGTLNYLRYLLGLEPDAERAERLVVDAQRDLEAATERDPTLASAYSVLSHLYANRDDLVSLVITARRALEEDTYLRDADRVTHRLGLGHYDLEQFRDARTWCDEGARRFPDNYRFVECQLWLLAAPPTEADVDEAWRLAARLDSVAPETMRAYEQRAGRLAVAAVLRKNGMTDSAEVVFAQAKGDDQIDPLQDLVLYEAAMRATTGDPDGAIEVLGRYLAASPEASIDREHWWWRSIRDRQDFEALVRRTN